MLYYAPHAFGLHLLHIPAVCVLSFITACTTTIYTKPALHLRHPASLSVQVRKGNLHITTWEYRNASSQDEERGALEFILVGRV